MPVYPVRGKVFIDGQPAAGADIVLYPTTPLTDMDADYPRAGVANDGTYAIGTYGQADGAPAGRYMVSIYKGGDSSDEGPQFKKPRTVDPFRKFKDPANSGLTLEVSEGKNDGKDFDLKSTRY